MVILCRFVEEVFLKCCSLFVVVKILPFAFHKIMRMYINVQLYVGDAQKDTQSVAYSLGFVWLFYR